MARKKRIQYQKQKEIELNQLIRLKDEEMNKRELIEFEKQRLVKENEDILKVYYPKEYHKILKGLKNNI